MDREPLKTRYDAYIVMLVSVTYASRLSSLPSIYRVKRWVQLTSSQSKPSLTSMDVRFVNRMESRQLNARYRQRDYPTNVLTFVYDNHADVVLCAPVVRTEATEQGKLLISHYAHLIIHGTLHALGFDHQTSRMAKDMESREISLMSYLGYANPYT